MVWTIFGVFWNGILHKYIGLCSNAIYFSRWKLLWIKYLAYLLTYNVSETHPSNCSNIKMIFHFYSEFFIIGMIMVEKYTGGQKFVNKKISIKNMSSKIWRIRFSKHEKKMSIMSKSYPQITLNRFGCVKNMTKMRSKVWNIDTNFVVFK